jgi:TIR domain/NACHT domain
MPSMVFISHSSKDRETADAICAHLESAGIKCWIAPRDIEPGATWTKGIMQGLEGCRVLAFLNDAWTSEHVNVVTIVAWAGVGKSTLVNHWLGRMAAEDYRSAQLVFGWSFYRQGTSGESSSADEFLDAALAWFGDPDPRIGTAWEKGERLAKLVAHRRTILVLDGLEPLQNPPGPQEGRVREPSLQALLRELAAFNKGLCVITTRLPIADIADRAGVTALRRELEQLSSDSGAKLLRALGVTGQEAELQSASDEFGGHCLALTLLGSYLSDAYDGDIRCRKEVSERLAYDVRQGVHARKVMESYQTWFREGPELSVLRILVHQVSDWGSGAAGYFGWMREAKRENTRCGL